MEKTTIELDNFEMAILVNIMKLGISECIKNNKVNDCFDEFAEMMKLYNKIVVDEK